MWNYSPWALLPPIFSACTAVGLWTVYFVAVKHEKISPLSSQHWKKNGSLYPPYISMAGNFPPASCIFSEVMNLAAFVGFIIAVLRYHQLKHVIDKPWLNVGSLVLFSIGCFGMTLIGNFQLLTEKAIHNSGTFMTFGLGTVYCWVQSYITLKANLKNEGRKVAIVRFLLSASITLCMVLHFTLVFQRLHMDAARCQWALVMFFLIFLGTFATEFRHNRFDVVCTDNCGGPVSLSETHSEVSTHQPDQPDQL
ncbi:transmembrane protein 150C [Toxotes jaculatrix]|uniref:transmembrane protein 150C n=1 Tax=Toxotes jaculatrix TaxID=941984 RepID=UPI001B3AD8DD|nr:transmembrane protein 150C [Toxotes jaculatrix]XP_040914124.1 transmembrane protein 150C [Toxotes jaculatrix]XP_040914125.1 transmembrane protein 150C [Toxotes jaculatrix]XP_040914126.1 transmembrane protein 150C [Toxotes jaculatrix]